MKRVAVISAVLDEPEKTQIEFNNILTNYKSIIKGRMGIPFEEEGVSIISVIVIGDLNKINALTGKLGTIPFISVKTSISKKKIK